MAGTSGEKTMNVRVTIACMLAISFAFARGDSSLVRFANGDLLPGTPAGLEPGSLIWSSALLEHDARFDSAQVLDVLLPVVFPASEDDHIATVVLKNGDAVSGRLAGADDSGVELATDFAGTMKFRRSMIRGVSIEDNSNVIYRGPVDLAEWHEAESGKAWKHHRGALVSHDRGVIARDDLLPARCSVAFTLAWKEPLHISVIVQSKDPEPAEPRSGYNVVFSRVGIYLINGKTNQHLSGNAAPPALRDEESARLEIRSDSATGHVSVRINDEVVEAWTDPQHAAGEFGKVLHFSSKQSSGALRVSDIVVKRWDGAPDVLPRERLGRLHRGRDEAQAEEKNEDNGRIQLANGDSLTGDLRSVTAAGVRIETGFGEILLPPSRLRQLGLKPAADDMPIRRAGDVRAWFANGGSLVFRLDSWRDGEITGSSQTFGTTTFRESAFRRIEFNLYNNAFQGLRSKEP
ncbi:MAG: hypothetical protein V4733_11530 [Verrucomicrobiota bacterium]